MAASETILDVENLSVHSGGFMQSKQETCWSVWM